MGTPDPAIDLIVVDKDVLRQRMDAARALRGMTQVQLRELFEEDGLGKHDVGRLERGELALRRTHLDALVRHLRVPEWWFTAEEIEFPETMPTFNDAIREVVEASIRPIVQELLRPPSGLERLGEDESRSSPDPDEPKTDQDPPPPAR